MAQSYPDPWMDKYWSLRHLLLDIAHMGRDEFVRTADIMSIKFTKGENWPHEMFDTLYDDVMQSVQKGETGRYMELIKALIQATREQIGTLSNVGSAAQLVGVLEGTIKDLEKELKG